MHITKLEHACLDIRHNASRLIVDPGVFATSLTDMSNITTLVITHVHPDHFEVATVKKIVEQSPDVQIFTTQDVADTFEAAQLTVAVVGTTYQAGDFTLEFFGGQHAKIIDGYPAPGQDKNIGVLINDTLYYPGDSLEPCPKPHTITAVPAMAPWLKLAEAVDFLHADTAHRVFPTHNGFLNDAGVGLHNTLLSGAVEQAGKEYMALAPGDTIESA